MERFEGCLRSRDIAELDGLTPGVVASLNGVIFNKSRTENRA